MCIELILELVGGWAGILFFLFFVQNLGGTHPVQSWGICERKYWHKEEIGGTKIVLEGENESWLPPAIVFPASFISFT